MFKENHLREGTRDGSLGLSKLMSSCKKETQAIDKHQRERKTLHRAHMRACHGMSISPSRALRLEDLNLWL